jgi:hypothetical protein
MNGFSIKFRDFDNVYVSLSYYVSGNIRVDVYSGDIKLCELTTDIMSGPLQKGIMAVKDTAYSKEILQLFMQMDFISCYIPMVNEGTKTYLCGLTKDYPASKGSNVIQQRVAMGGSF